MGWELILLLVLQISMGSKLAQSNSGMSSNEYPGVPRKTFTAKYTWYEPGMNIRDPKIISGHKRSPYFSLSTWPM